MNWVGSNPAQVDTNTLKLAKRVVNMSKVVHIATKDEFLHFHVESGEVEPHHIQSADCPADLGTKPLSRELFMKHRATIMGETLSEQFSKSTANF